MRSKKGKPILRRFQPLKSAGGMDGRERGRNGQDGAKIGGLPLHIPKVPKLQNHYRAVFRATTFAAAFSILSIKLYPSSVQYTTA